MDCFSLPDTLICIDKRCTRDWSWPKRHLQCLGAATGYNTCAFCVLVSYFNVSNLADGLVASCELCRILSHRVDSSAHFEPPLVA